jgi:hypothetical protein
MFEIQRICKWIIKIYKYQNKIKGIENGNIKEQNLPQ